MSRWIYHKSKTRTQQSEFSQENIIPSEDPTYLNVDTEGTRGLHSLSDCHFIEEG